MEAVVLFGLFIVLLSIRVNIGLSIALSLIVTMVVFTDLPMVLVAQQSIVGVDSFPLLAIPFFILAGNLMSRGGVAKRLVTLANEIFGYFTGGLAVVSTVTSAFFAAMSGSAVATTSAVGSFMIPEMEKNGYDKSYSAVAVAAAGTMGVILPPSIPYVIYGVVVGASISELFIAGLIPGILICVALIITNIITSRRNGYPGTGVKPSFKRILVAFKNAFWAILAPIIVLGGIYTGTFTPTEAAVVTVVYSLFVGVFIYKEIRLPELYESLKQTIIVSGVTTFMVGISTAFASFLTIQQIPSELANLILSISDEKIIILLLMNVFLLIVGSIVDNIPATIILSPIFLPVVVELGMSPVQLGIIITMNLAIGFFTPPYGINLFVASAVANVGIDKMMRHIIAPVLASLVVLMMVTYIPELTMFLVDLLK